MTFFFELEFADFIDLLFPKLDSADGAIDGFDAVESRLVGLGESSTSTFSRFPFLLE